MPGDERVVPPPSLDIDERERLREPGWPTMAFIERRLADDDTNWWAANAACVEAMARSAGLRVDSRPAHETWLCSPAVAR
jgi:tRNA (mo5U34)-methyltransferase